MSFSPRLIFLNCNEGDCQPSIFIREPVPLLSSMRQTLDVQILSEGQFWTCLTRGPSTASCPLLGALQAAQARLRAPVADVKIVRSVELCTTTELVCVSRTHRQSLEPRPWLGGLMRVLLLLLLCLFLLLLFVYILDKPILSFL